MFYCLLFKKYKIQKKYNKLVLLIRETPNNKSKCYKQILGDKVQNQEGYSPEYKLRPQRN